MPITYHGKPHWPQAPANKLPATAEGTAGCPRLIQEQHVPNHDWCVSHGSSSGSDLGSHFLGQVTEGLRLAQKVDYPAFGVLAPHSHDSTSSGDKKLAHSAQMYHYQHQKQQMLSLKHRDEAKMTESGATSDEENEDGDFTVYECPGLAPTGEMEVRNPLFDDSTLHLHAHRGHK
ncbi:neural proliferation differentiation and control protein 1-like [Clupea harengus]|uniref:Neural proliferation differentiation and control protein 1-like n=1 Tax=Clupea harengus TaxID=7950 RepID=A0A8M1KJ20_CLUHA|nr:neural proliferation differentiation and control protein 1-like [Clupea harengus]